MYETNTKVADVKKFLVLYEGDKPLAIIKDPEDEQVLREHEKELQRNGYRLSRDWFPNEKEARVLLGLVKDLVDAVKAIIAKIKEKRVVKRAARKAKKK